ncbi:hypothetical protein [Brasilonema sp. UFV-L1]|uniref:hypothetical protein n=1 Tax=Brasilonema sp. UFV-L1 TaxID=2234130 RepID=UPI00145C9550|nr:hypothetical protein [Brasilonema sp. UFV-L1]NMG08021.1 hypothetical protein [Brasilonema sp. UFV-L1]
MNVIIRSLNAFTLSVFASVLVPPYVAQAQNTLTTPEQTAKQDLCSSEIVKNLQPSPARSQSPSPFSYLRERGFTQKPDGSWVCYMRDNRKQERYYTLFKVQQVNGTLLASSFLESGILIEGQDNRSLDLFMTVIDKHTNTNQSNRQSIQKYLESFISLVKQGKIPPSGRAYLFNQSNRGFVLYHSITRGELQGTAITININSPQNLGPSPVSGTKSLGGRL